jgi:hypothetical protein
MPTHYSFKVNSRLDRIQERYNKLSSKEWSPPVTQPLKVQNPDMESVREILDSIDKRGAWVEDGKMRYWGENDDTTRVIHPHTFVKNTIILASYIYHHQQTN